MLIPLLVIKYFNLIPFGGLLYEHTDCCGNCSPVHVYDTYIYKSHTRAAYPESSVSNNNANSDLYSHCKYVNDFVVALYFQLITEPVPIHMYRNAI